MNVSGTNIYFSIWLYRNCEDLVVKALTKTITKKKTTPIDGVT